MSAKFRNAVIDSLDGPLRWPLKYLVRLCGAGRMGALEAFRCKARLDTWSRYALVRKHLQGVRPGERVRLLDVGGGAAELLNLIDDPRYLIFTLDLDRKALGNAPGEARLVCADALRMPFADGAFDAVLSVDSLEHIPNDAMRAVYLDEMQRLSRGPFILHFPADSDSGDYQGLHYDRLFNAAHRKYFGTTEPNTDEHLQNGLPNVDWIRRRLPQATIQGTSHGPLWYRYMLLQRLPFVRLLLVLWYQVWGRRRDHTPPYHGCLVVVK